MIQKLRFRFVLITMAIVTGMLLVIFSLVFGFTKNDLTNKSDLMLQALSQSVREPLYTTPEIQLPYFILQINTWGEVYISGDTNQDLTDAQYMKELISLVLRQEDSTGYLPAHQLKYSVIPGLGVQKIVFLDVSGHQSALNSLLRTSFFIAIAALAAFTGIAVALAHWMVTPVEKAWLQQKQFVSDASHELKTPLSVIISNAELMQSPDCTLPEHQHYTENILSGAGQMRALVENLLELARADDGKIRTAFAPLDLSNAVCQCILPFEPVFYENQMLLQWEVSPNIRVQGSAQHLRQLTEILLDNARKYGSPGIVRLTLHRISKNQCMLTVSNPGNPIPKEDLKRIFERFYRSDTSRQNTGSFGLGLAIARQIVRDHRGTIWAESNHTGNRFCVQLPCLPE